MSLNVNTGVLSDTVIRKIFKQTTAGMIHPFVDHNDKADQEGKITWGLTSCGYDVRLGYDFKSYLDHDVLWDPGLDPKCPAEDAFESFVWEEDSYLLAPGEFLLGTTIETFLIPAKIMGLCIARSTYARHGVICHTTPLIPGFQGQVTLEIVNTCNRAVKIYPGEGICQFIFFNMTGDAEKDYAQLGGRYMHQIGTTGPRR